MSRFCISLFCLLALVFFSTTILANNQAKVDSILKQKTPPFGVVFEVVESDEDAVNWAFPQIKRFAEQLRKKFPEIGIAVVSHGKEEFALTKENQKEYKEVHNTVKSLVSDNIPVHICETHASWYQTKASDFPDYISISPAGPTEIENYEDMGYELIVLEEP